MEFVGNVQLVAGDSSALPAIFDVLREAGIEPRGNPDVYVREYHSFGVEEARELAHRASSRALASPRRVFVAVAPGMTAEAQNALLKTLEEPAEGTLFFLVVPSPEGLLPTLRSRAQFLEVVSERSDAPIDPAAFMRAKPQDRLAMLKPFLDKDGDDRPGMGGAIAFFAALEHELSRDPKKHREGLGALYRARKYIGDKGASAKALLEQVALLL